MSDDPRPPRSERKPRRRKKAAVARAQQQLKRSGGRARAGRGVPKAVDRGLGQGAPSPRSHPRGAAGGDARVSWLLDALAWAGHGAVAPRLDLRGVRSPLPAVVLPAVGEDQLVALDHADAIRALRSRHRAFSQIAGRYSALVLAARESGRSLHIEVWDIDDRGALLPEDAALVTLLPQLATYLEATVVYADAALRAARVATLQTAALPAALVDRNPVACGLALGAGQAVAEPAVQDSPSHTPPDTSPDTPPDTPPDGDAAL